MWEKEADLGWGGIFYQENPLLSFPFDLLVRRLADVDRRLRFGDFFMKEIMREGKVLFERTGG